jgi:hypothetical protein
MNMVTFPGGDYLLVRTVVVIGRAGMNDMLIVLGDDASVFAPPNSSGFDDDGRDGGDGGGGGGSARGHNGYLYTDICK